MPYFAALSASRSRRRSRVTKTSRPMSWCVASCRQSLTLCWSRLLPGLASGKRSRWSFVASLSRCLMRRSGISRRPNVFSRASRRSRVSTSGVNSTSRNASSETLTWTRPARARLMTSTSCSSGSSSMLRKFVAHDVSRVAETTRGSLGRTDTFGVTWDRSPRVRRALGCSRLPGRDDGRHLREKLGADGAHA
jgi:hypothetical protein